MFVRNENKLPLREMRPVEREFIAKTFLDGHADKIDMLSNESGEWIPMNQKGSGMICMDFVYRICSLGPLKVKWNRINQKWNFAAIHDSDGSVMLISAQDPEAWPTLRYFHGYYWEVDDSDAETNFSASDFYPDDTFILPAGVDWKKSLTMRPREGGEK